MKPTELAPRLHRIIGLIRRHHLAIGITVIIILAFFFRFWRIWDLPPGLDADEAVNGIGIVKHIFRGDIQAFYPNSNGGSLFMFWQAPFVKILGNTALALRLPAALLSFGTVLIVYLWLKEWFSQRAALLASLLMATSSWAVGIGRLGLQATSVAFMIAFVGWLATLAIKKHRWYLCVLSGLALGAGFYSHYSFRYMAIALILILGHALVWQRQALKKALLPITIMVLVAALTLVPLSLYAMRHSGEVIKAPGSINLTDPKPAQTLQTLGSNAARTAAMFNVKGGDDWRFNLGGQPMLNALSGTLFILGLLLALRRIKDIRYFSLLIIFSVMLLPALLSTSSAAATLAAYGVIPTVFALTAVGLAELVARWNGVFPRNPAAYWVMILGVLTVLAAGIIYDYQRYFVAWANTPEAYNAFNPGAIAAASYINSHDELSYRVLASEEDNRVIEYLTYQRGHYKRVSNGDINTPSTAKLLLVVGEQSLPKIDATKTKLKLSTTQTSQRLKNRTLFKLYELKWSQSKND